MSRAQPTTAGDKVTFLLALVPYLIDHESVTVSEVARHFEVTEKQVRDAVEFLTVSGIPGATGTYQHGDLFDVAWDQFDSTGTIVLTNLVALNETPRLSGREAAALIAGLQYLSASTEHDTADAITTLMSKLASGASAVPTPLAVDATATHNTVSQLSEALSRGHQVEFVYVSAQGTQDNRRVDPLRVESLDSVWYLRGWCHSRDAARTFRLDRMREVTVTSRPVLKERGQVALSDTLFDGSDADLEVTVECASAAFELLADYVGSSPVEQLPGERCRATIRVSHEHGLKRLVCGMPGLVQVAQPTWVRQSVHSWASDALRNYELAPTADAQLGELK